MEPPRYYQLEHDNTYSVHFANKQGLSNAQIYQIFKEFGTVANVTMAGDTFGFRFVKYKNENDVKRCIEQMQNHKTIKLLPKRVKQQSNGQKNTTKGKQETNNECPQNNVANSKTSNTCRTNIQQRLTRNQERSHNDHTATSATETSIPAIETIKLGSNIEDFQAGCETVSSVNNRNNNNVKPAANMVEPVPENNSTIDDEVLKVPVCSQLETICSSNHSILGTVPEDLPEDLPDLIIPKYTQAIQKEICDEAQAKNVQSPSLSLKMKRNVPAEEVCVANIPMEFGVNYILHLLEKYNPICATGIKYVKSTAIRFCTVFFRTPEEANACEAELDDHELGGKKLMILRAKTIRDIASSC